MEAALAARAASKQRANVFMGWEWDGCKNDASDNGKIDGFMNQD